MNSALRALVARRTWCAIGCTLAAGAFIGCGGPEARPEIAAPNAYHVAAPTVLAWQDGATAYVLLEVATVYPSRADDDAKRFKPTVEAARADEIELEKELGLGWGNDRRSEAVDGSRDKTSGWTVADLWRGHTGAEEIRRVSARVCWEDGERCARVSFGGCTAEGLPDGDRVREARDFHGTEIPAGARILYSRSDSDPSGRGECGRMEVTALSGSGE